MSYDSTFPELGSLAEGETGDPYERARFEAFPEDYEAGYSKAPDELDFDDAFAESFGGVRSESGYNDGYADGAAEVASEIDEVLECDSFIDCNCKAHKIIRRVLIGSN